MLCRGDTLVHTKPLFFWAPVEASEFQSQRHFWCALSPILVYKLCEASGRCMPLQMGGVCVCVCALLQECILLQQHRDRNGSCIAILFKSIEVDVSLLMEVQGKQHPSPNEKKGCVFFTYS